MSEYKLLFFPVLQYMSDRNSKKNFKEVDIGAVRGESRDLRMAKWIRLPNKRQGLVPRICHKRAKAKGDDSNYPTTIQLFSAFHPFQTLSHARINHVQL